MTKLSTNSTFSASKSKIVTRVSARSKKGCGPYIKWSDLHWNFQCRVPTPNFKILSSDNNNKMAILTMPQLKHGRNFPKKKCLAQRTQSLLENAKYTWKPTSTRYFLRSVWTSWALEEWRVSCMRSAATLQLVTAIKQKLWALLVRLQFQSKTKRMLIIE